MAFEGIFRNNYGRLLPLCNLSVSDGFQAREVGVPKALIGLEQGVCFHIYTAGILYTSIEKQTVARLLATSGLLWAAP